MSEFNPRGGWGNMATDTGKVQDPFDVAFVYNSGNSHVHVKSESEAESLSIALQKQLQTQAQVQAQAQRRFW